jgi:ribosomal protein L19
MYFSEKWLAEEFYKDASFFTRGIVDGFKNVFCIYPGDILEIFFFYKGSSYIFEGVCLGLRRKKLLKVESMFMVRNFVQNIGVEFVFSYFYNRLYFLKVKDYKQKSFVFSRSYFFFLRQRLNQSTKVL